jgi:hypothetical protein
MPFNRCGKCAKHISICKHHRRKTRCVDCAIENGGRTGSVCMHNRRKYQCTECAKLGLTSHQRSEVCPCGVRKRYCRVHGGANLCRECNETTVAKAGALCRSCDVDSTTKLRVKKRELEVMEWITHLPAYSSYNKSLASILRKDISGVDPAAVQTWFDFVRTTRTFYPDFMWVLPDRYVILEIDEHQHRTFHKSRTHNYKNDKEREVTMLRHISMISNKLIVLVRYNPDAFGTGFKPRGRHLSMQTSREARKEVLLDTLHTALGTTPALAASSSPCQRDTPCVPGKAPACIVYYKLFFDCTCSSFDSCGFQHRLDFENVSNFEQHYRE